MRICMKVLASESMKPNQIKRHLEAILTQETYLTMSISTNSGFQCNVEIFSGCRGHSCSRPEILSCPGPQPARSPHSVLGPLCKPLSI